MPRDGHSSNPSNDLAGSKEKDAIILFIEN